MTEFLFSIIELEGVLVYRQFIYFMKNRGLCGDLRPRVMHRICKYRIYTEKIDLYKFKNKHE